MTPEHIGELFAKTLAGDYEDDAPWQAVHDLRCTGSREIFDRAVQWCGSRDPLIRTRGLDVVAQIGRTADHASNSFPDESLSIVAAVLRDEQEIRPLYSAITALGHLDNPAAIPLILRFQSHSSSDIRHAVAFALGSFPNDPRTSEGLLALMKDPDEKVRDWATFALGVLGELDSAEIRAALFERLNDADEDVRAEAMAGLGKRRDRRVLTALVEALAEADVSHPVIEAACHMLGMQAERENWNTADYASALRERFEFRSGQ